MNVYLKYFLPCQRVHQHFEEYWGYKISFKCFYNASTPYPTVDASKEDDRSAGNKMDENQKDEVTHTKHGKKHSDQ